MNNQAMKESSHYRSRSFSILYQDEWTKKCCRQESINSNKSRLFFSFIYLSGLTCQNSSFLVFSFSPSHWLERHTRTELITVLKTTYTPSPGSSFKVQNNHSSSLLFSFFHTLAVVSFVVFLFSNFINKNQYRQDTPRWGHTHTRCRHSLSHTPRKEENDVNVWIELQKQKSPNSLRDDDDTVWLENDTTHTKACLSYREHNLFLLWSYSERLNIYLQKIYQGKK